MKGDRAGSELAHTAGKKSWWRNGKIDQSHFFDFEYAKSAFENFQDLNDLDNGYDAEFNAWNEAYKNKPEDALVALDSHPDKVKIMQAHDLQWTYLAWHHIVWGRYSGSDWDVFPDSMNSHSWQGWNNWSNNFCTHIRLKNIFDDSCTVPDWRGLNQKKREMIDVNSSQGLNKRDITLLEGILRDENLGEQERQRILSILAQLKSD